MTLQAEPLARVGAELGEGPVWRAETGDVLWVDILRGELHALDLATALAGALEAADRLEVTLDTPVGAVALDRAGGPVLATPDGLVRVDGQRVAALPRDAPDVRMNDGKPDPQGRFVGGTMTLGEARPGAGSLWSFAAGEAPVRLVAGATIANGLAWSADGTTLFWIDTPTGRIDAFTYDPDTGGVGDRRTWAEIDPDHGHPDGMCIDAEGGLWVALWGGGAVRRYRDGACDEVVEVPTPFVTCPTFAGADLDRLVITTASIEFGDDPPPLAGDLFTVEVGPVGLPPHRLGSWA